MRLFGLVGDQNGGAARVSGDVRSMSSAQQLDYIASMAGGLQSMAAGCGCSTLAGLFDLARREAELQRRV